MLLRTLLCLSFAALPALPLPGSDGVTVSVREEACIHQILSACVQEIASAEAILKQAVSEPERAFAKQLGDLHLTMRRVLITIARNKQLALRDGVEADEQARAPSTAAEGAHAATAAFITAAVVAAAAEIALCEGELRDGGDEDLKLFARTYLPALQKCLATARALSAPR